MTEEGIFLGGGSNSGNFEEGFIPNVKGSTGSGGPLLYYYGFNGSGPFERGEVSNGGFQHTHPDYRALSFDASRCSNKYKDGVNKITVDRYIVEFYIKYK